MIKLALLLGYKCNNNCIFCYAGDKRNFREMTTREALSRMREGRERGANMIDFLGGEPTIRSDLLELVKYAKLYGFREIAITTNGRMLGSYPKYCEKLLEAGLNHVILSIHGHYPGLHDGLTRSKGSFHYVLKAARMLVSHNIYVCTNTVMVRPNIKHLVNIAKKNESLGVQGMEFIFPHPRGNALRNFEVIPTLTEIKEPVKKLMDYGEKSAIKHFVLRYLPLCYMDNREDRFLSELTSKMKEKHVGPEFEDYDVERNRALYGRVKGEMCSKCAKKDICEGIWKEYADRRGTSELRPIKNTKQKPKQKPKPKPKPKPKTPHPKNKIQK